MPNYEGALMRAPANASTNLLKMMGEKSSPGGKEGANNFSILYPEKGRSLTHSLVYFFQQQRIIKEREEDKRLSTSFLRKAAKFFKMRAENEQGIRANFVQVFKGACYNMPVRERERGRN
jgi:hypothetical protein